VPAYIHSSSYHRSQAACLVLDMNSHPCYLKHAVDCTAV
jgi:hypothetical protein